MCQKMAQKIRAKIAWSHIKTSF